MTLFSYINWAARPDVLMMGGLEVRWYGLAFALGFYLGLLMLTKMFISEKAKESWVDSLFLYVVIATVLGARLGHVFFYAWDYYSQHLWDIFKIWEGGLASHGGSLAIIIAIWLYSKKVTQRSMLWTLDRLAVPVALVAALIRLGNLMNHEIYGVPTNLPWGFRFVENIRAWQLGAEPIYGLPAHPTQIYEALCYLITFGLLLFLYWKRPKMKHQEGLLLGIFLIGIFFSRFMIEFVKENQEAFEAGWALNMGQILSIPFFLAGILLIVRSIKRAPVYYKPVEEDKPIEKKTKARK